MARHFFARGAIALATLALVGAGFTALLGTGANPYLPGFAAMVALLAAVDEGLGACFFGQFEHEAAVKAAFAIPADRTPVGTIALGYAAAEGDPVALRIAQEAAFLADRSDISEEIVRTRSHIEQFRRIVDADEPSGRKLNFLLQEFNREFNTMGAKAGSAPISHIIVAVKTELEKIREQVQNIE